MKHFDTNAPQNLLHSWRTTLTGLAVFGLALYVFVEGRITVPELLALLGASGVLGAAQDWHRCPTAQATHSAHNSTKPNTKSEHEKPNE
jgi:hypothetical protein